MTHVITSRCIDVKDLACVKCCPVDCIYEGERTLYINPDECIDCGICISVCPTEAIFDAVDLPADEAHFLDINREFFEPHVNGVGRLGDASALGQLRVDHPTVAAYPKDVQALDSVTNERNL